MRTTPFALAFGEIEPRFPAIAEALRQDGAAVTDRDRFVLLEPVGRLLKEIMPEGAGADALEVHALLLHHAYQFWAAEQPVYQISDEVMRRAALEKRTPSCLILRSTCSCPSYACGVRRTKSARPNRSTACL